MICVYIRLYLDIVYIKWGHLRYVVNGERGFVLFETLEFVYIHFTRISTIHI